MNLRQSGRKEPVALERQGREHQPAFHGGGRGICGLTQMITHP